MKYNGIELKEFTSDKSVLFDPPRKMLVWNDINDEPYKAEVWCFIPRRHEGVICSNGQDYEYCAEIPEYAKPR